MHTKKKGILGPVVQDMSPTVPPKSTCHDSPYLNITYIHIYLHLLGVLQIQTYVWQH